jgi:hypothetical protein
VHPAYAVLFNSYYNGVGAQHPRAERGLLSRPTLAEVRDYRARVDNAVAALLAVPGVWNRIRVQAPPGTLSVEFTPAGPGRLEVRTLSRTEGWPQGLPPLPARSPREMAFGDSDTALVRDARTFSW